MKQYKVSNNGEILFEFPKGQTGIVSAMTYTSIPFFPDHLHGKEVFEGKDFVKHHEVEVSNKGELERWLKVTPSQYEISLLPKRIVAKPIPIEKEAVKQDVYYKGRIYKYCANVRVVFIDIRTFEKMIFELQSFPYTGTDLKDGQVVVEGKDYYLQHQVKSNELFKTTDFLVVSKKHYEKTVNETIITDRRIVAIPLQSDNTEGIDESLWEVAHQELKEAMHITIETSGSLKWLSERYFLTRKP